jgi:hypothetical protein
MEVTFDILSSDGFDCDVVVGGPVVALVDLAILSCSYFSAKDVVVDQLRHRYRVISNGYLLLKLPISTFEN